MDRFALWVESVGSQDKAAALLGVSQTHVSQMVRGDRRPGIDTALTIERVTVDWVDEETGELLGPIKVAEWGATKVFPRKRAVGAS